jgi:hypothetical protein
MTFLGTVYNGVIVLAGGQTLPEGTIVQVAPQPSASDHSKSKPIGECLAELAEWAETQPCDLPADLARNHDHYLHGLPKQK